VSELFSGNLPTGHLPHRCGSSSTGCQPGLCSTLVPASSLKYGRATRDPSSARSGIAGEHCRKNGEKMQGIARGPLGVTREAAGTYERQTGFQGVRTIMVEHTVRVIVPFQGVIQPPWRPALVRARGNSGQHLNNSVAFSRNCACPATRPGRILSPLPAGGVAP